MPDRLRYALSVCYWTLRHRSLSIGRWVADYSTTKGPAAHGKV